jgi:hypothetical protein
MNENHRVEEFVKRAKKHLALILPKSGRVLYSFKGTLKKGQFYILGLNPAGDEKGDFKDKTINNDLKEWCDRNEEWNNLLDESWGNKEKGEHKIQKRLRWLIEVGLDYGSLRNICASNIVFVRSPNVAELEEDFTKCADKCWPVHKDIIRIVQPKVLLVFGNSGSKSPYGVLLRRAKKILSEKACYSGHGSWDCKSFISEIEGRVRTVIGIPHLSRYDVIGNERRPAVNWIKKQIGEALKSA